MYGPNTMNGRMVGCGCFCWGCCLMAVGWGWGARRLFIPRGAPAYFVSNVPHKTLCKTNGGRGIKSSSSPTLQFKKRLSLYGDETCDL